MTDKNERREPRHCANCGRKLYGRFYWAGYCSQCQMPGDAQLSKDAHAAIQKGISYGQYMAQKYEARRGRR